MGTGQQPSITAAFILPLPAASASIVPSISAPAAGGPSIVQVSPRLRHLLHPTHSSPAGGASVAAATHSHTPSMPISASTAATLSDAGGGGGDSTPASSTTSSSTTSPSHGYSNRKRPQSSLSSSQSLSTTTAAELSALVFPPPGSPQSYPTQLHHSSRAAIATSPVAVGPSPRASPRGVRTILRASRQSSQSQNSASMSLQEEHISAEMTLPHAGSLLPLASVSSIGAMSATSASSATSATSSKPPISRHPSHPTRYPTMHSTATPPRTSVTGGPPPRRPSLLADEDDEGSSHHGGNNTLHPLLLRFRRADIESFYIDYSSAKNDEEAWKLIILCLFLYLLPFILQKAFITPFDLRFLVVRVAVFVPVFSLLWGHYGTSLLSTAWRNQLALTSVALAFFVGEHFDAYSSGDNQNLIDMGAPIFFCWVLPSLHLRFPHTLFVTVVSLTLRLLFTILLATGYPANMCMNGKPCQVYSTTPLLALGHEAILVVVGLASCAYCWHCERIERREFWYRNLLAETVDNNQILLQRMLPTSVIAKLQKGDTIIAERFDHVSLLFADLVGFQRLVSQASPVFVVHVLDKVFNLFDELSEQYGVYKVETVFDTWVGACGIQEDEEREEVGLTREERERLRLTRSDSEEEVTMKRCVNATRIAQLALAMAKVGERLEAEIKADIEEWERRAHRMADEQQHSSALDHVHTDPSTRQHSPSARLAALLPSLSLSIRVGIHSGSVMAGVIGRKLPRYRLFGDTVNTTARMCTNGAGGRVHVSPEAAAILSSSVVYPRIECIDHSTRSIKGKGLITTCWLRHDDDVLMQQCQPRFANNSIVTFPAPDIVTLNTVPEGGEQQLLFHSSEAGKLTAGLAGRLPTIPDRGQSPSSLVATVRLPGSIMHPSISSAANVGTTSPSASPSPVAAHPASTLPLASKGLFMARGSASAVSHLLSFADLVHRNTLLQREEANEWGEEVSGRVDGGGDSGSAATDGRMYRMPNRGSRRFAQRSPLHKVSPSPRLQRRKVSDGTARMRAFTAAAAGGELATLQQYANVSPVLSARPLNKPIARGRSVMVKQQRSPVGSSAVLAQRSLQAATVAARGHSSINSGQAVRRGNKRKERRVKVHADGEDGEAKSDDYSAEDNTTGEESSIDEAKEDELLSHRDKHGATDEDAAATVVTPIVPRSPSSPLPPDSIIVTPSTPVQTVAPLSHQQPTTTAVMEKLDEEERKEQEPLSPVPPSSPPIRTVSSPPLIDTLVGVRPPSSPPPTIISASAASSPKQLRLRPSHTFHNHYHHHRARTLGQFNSFSPVSSQPGDAAGLGKRRLRKKYGSAGLQDGSPSSSRRGSGTSLPTSDSIASQPAPSVTTAAAPLSQPPLSSPTAGGLSPRTVDDEQHTGHPSPSAVSHHLSLPSASNDDRSSFSSQLIASHGSSFSAPGPGTTDEARLSVTHSRSSRVFHVSEAKREKEYQKQRKVSAMMGSGSPLTHSPLRGSHSRSLVDRETNPSIVALNTDSHSSIIGSSSSSSSSAGNNVLMMSPSPQSHSHLSTLPTLDTDDLPFHMLDPETMKLGLDLSFVDYPGHPHTHAMHMHAYIQLYRNRCCDGKHCGSRFCPRLCVPSRVSCADLERKYQLHQQLKIYDWLTFRLTALIGAFMILSIIDLTMRLTRASDPTLPALYGQEATNRFVIRVACGAIPCSLLIFAMNRSRSPRVLCLKQPFIRLFQHLSHAVLVLLCILSANLFLTDVLLPEPNIDSWCGVIVLCGLASSLFRLPSTHNLLFVSWSTFCYLLAFVMVPLVWPGMIVDEDEFSLGLVLQCVIFCVCMFCLFYVNSRVLEVRTRERYLTLLAIKKQRKDTSALLERLLPKTVITQLLQMGRRSREDSALARPATGDGGVAAVVVEEMSAVARVERQMSTTSQSGQDRRQSSSKAFSFPAKSIATPRSPLSQFGERKRALSSSAVSPHPPHSARLGSLPAVPAVGSPQISKPTPMLHQRGLSSATAVAPPLGAPSLLASFYPSVTVMQADVCSFTPLCARSTPQQVITMLNSLFLLFDSLTDQYAVYKVETIGDAVLAVCGAPTADTHHALRMCELSLAARDALRAFTPAHDSTPVRMRFGLHSGRVVGGVVGLKKMPRFHIYGQTVSTAGAMEQAAEPMTICMSADTWRSVKENDEWAVPKFEVRRIGRQQRPHTAGNGSGSAKSSGDDSNRSEDGSDDDEDDVDGGGGGGGTSKRVVMYELVRRKAAMADEQEAGQRMPAHVNRHGGVREGMVASE